MPRSSTEVASPTHAAVRAVLIDRYQHRAVTGTKYHLGPVYSQIYPQGPVAWRVSLHVDDRGGDGEYAAQVTVECRRTDGEVRIFAESRRSPATGHRLTPTEAHLDLAAKAALKIASRLEETEGYAAPDPRFRPASQPRSRVVPADPGPILDLFGV